MDDDDDTQVYKKPWVDLTDDEIWTLHDSYPNPVEFARAIEQLSKEKNL